MVVHVDVKEGVGVAVQVGEGVADGVSVSVGVGVGEGVEVIVGVSVRVGEEVEVNVGDAVAVLVEGGLVGVIVHVGRTGEGVQVKEARIGKVGVGVARRSGAKSTATNPIQ